MTEPDGATVARRAAARAALSFVEPDSVIGVGTGRAASAFIELLASAENRPRAAVASSVATASALRTAGIAVTDLPAGGRLPLYVDGADQVDPDLRLLKGRGGAHAREKVLASSSAVFICMVEDAKLADRLAGLVPVEVLPMAVAYATSELEARGGSCILREGFVTDNGGAIIDAAGLDLDDPAAMEASIAAIAGVVDSGIFAIRPADIVFAASVDGFVRDLIRPSR